MYNYDVELVGFSAQCGSTVIGEEDWFRSQKTTFRESDHDYDLAEIEIVTDKDRFEDFMAVRILGGVIANLSYLSVRANEDRLDLLAKEEKNARDAERENELHAIELVCDDISLKFVAARREIYEKFIFGHSTSRM